jgi:serine/threonine protein kinase
LASVLEKLIKRSGRLEAKSALGIATQVAAGLAAVQKLVHRDIKPSNIMVSVEEGGAVTAIFGRFRGCAANTSDEVFRSGARET